MAVAFLETSVLYCADNLRQLAQFPDECVDLIYLDPPFFSNRHYEVIWGDEAEVRSFEDRWKGGIEVYIDWMRDRVVQMRRVLRSTGSLYLHCDPHASHYLKVMLDGVFGSGNFRNEIIWKRTSAHNSAKRYGPVHDTILYYARDNPSVTWNQQHQAYGEKYVSSNYRHVDPESGQRYSLSDLTGAGTRQGDSGKPWRGFNPTDIGRHWQTPSVLLLEYARLTGEDLALMPFIDRLDELDRVGLIQWPKKNGGRPRHKRYLDTMPGVGLQDVWTDIDPISARAAERLGYPTQKPEDLLERIIAASSDEGATVLDPFCGCGTTVAVAERMGRHWIGIDISPTAVNLMKRRLERVENRRCTPKVIGLPVTADELRQLKPFEFQNWVIQKFWGTHSPRKSGDMGIDGYSFMVNDPIQVKQSDHVGRNVVDNFETAVRRAGKDKGYVIAFSFTRGAYEEVARARWEMKLDIRLVTVEELIAPEPDKILPELASVTELPLPPARSREARPSAQELINSDQRAV
jgi:DNA modification methylase